MARLLLLVIPFLAGCDIDTGSAAGGVQPDRGINNGPLPDGCTKIEGSQIGEPQTLVAGDVTIEITGWITKDGENGEYAGFTYTADGATDITIKAGEEVFVEDGDGTWIHPSGTFGSDVGAISNVVLCEGKDEPVGCDETDACNEVPPEDLNPVDPTDPGLGESGPCTTGEECASGICYEGTCVSI